MAGSRIRRQSLERVREELYAESLIPRLRIRYQPTLNLGFRGIVEYRTERFQSPASDAPVSGNGGGA